MTDPQRATAAAVAWHTRLNGRPSDQDRAAFADWLHQSPAHAAALAQVQRTWDGLAEILPPADATDADPDPDPELARLLARIRQHRDDAPATRRWGKSTMAAALLLALGAGGWLWLTQPHLLQDLGADQVTARGELRSLTLPDGSRVLLDADSAIDIQITADQRRVTLLRGTAHFDIQHADQPFTVAARNGEARVLGTAFDVDIQDGRVNVALSRGSVQVWQGDQHAQLSPGQAVDYDALGLHKPAPVDLTQATAWQQGRLVFNDTRLAEVVATIARHRPGRIVIASPALADRRISGAFSLQDPDAALESLRVAVGFRITRLTGLVTLIRP